jgi:aromatic ring-opening dioxygenase catalytic subunit (LigB family)
MLPTLFIPHGGGPLPILGSPCHTSLVGFLSKAARHVPAKPKAILLVSAHWEVRCTGVGSSSFGGCSELHTQSRDSKDVMKIKQSL